MRLLAAILLLACAGCTTTSYPVARVTFLDTDGTVLVKHGTAPWVSETHLVTVPHVALSDTVRVFPGRSGKYWVDAKVVARTATWCLIKIQPVWGFAGFERGDSGSPVLDEHGVLVGLIEGGTIGGMDAVREFNEKQAGQ